MELLLHICCAPCATYGSERFRELGYSIHGFFHNPNIHPFSEYRRRLDTLRRFCLEEDITLLVSDGYDPEGYLRAILTDFDNRCRICYRLRLGETAIQAKKLGIPCFATTLSISPYQDRELLRREGQEAAGRHGVEFVYEDLRPGFRRSVDESRRLGLYRQGYCGCLFSEKERYEKRRVD
jgi:predicted adenine nucleotide alpha hydrolase (AANH) superfamily ATPase